MKNLFKGFIAALAATMALAAFGGAQAADTVKGINQNGYQEVMAVEPIAAVKRADGKLFYRTQFTSTEYWMLDANGSQHANVLAAWSGNAATHAASGWTYSLKKARIMCQPVGTVIFVLGQTGIETLADSCQFFQVANGT